MKMPLVRYTEMPPYQQHCVREIYNDWEPEQYADFAFWVRKDGQLASRRAGRHQMTDEAAKRHMAKYSADVRTKGDLRGWKPGHTFSIVRD
jgi:tRNA(Ile)-lysidine synthase TilS/MesJ